MSLLDFDENNNETLLKFEKNKQNVINTEELDLVFNEWNKLETDGIKNRMKHKLIQSMHNINEQVKILNKHDIKPKTNNCYLITLKTAIFIGINYFIGIHIFSNFAP
tara:strand:- start:294 stop:614 length:321 start_codon:yes stop_codon:yes gene_type:complete